MDRGGFLKLLSKEFYTLLRNEGFKGSGTSLRRADAPFHHIVHFQGSVSASDCFINLGAHLDFLPTDGGNIFSPKDFTEPSCSFRTRLRSALRDPFNADRWSYGSTESEALITIREIIEAWCQQGRDFFRRHSSTDGATNMERLIQNYEGSNIHPHFALIGARIALHTGDVARALRIATDARERVGEQATLLLADFDDFIRLASARISHH